MAGNDDNHPTDEAAQVPELYGLLVDFDNVDDLVVAAGRVRDAGYEKWDVHTPFPVHGLDDAMGVRATRLPYVVLLAGIAGAGGTLLLQWWTNAIDYPYIVSGKPLFSLPANIPITFELIILFSALAAFGGGLALSNLPELFHPLLANRRFRRATTDGFFLGVDAADPQFDEAKTAEVLRSLGAGNVEIVHRPETSRKLPTVIVSAVAVLIALALLPPMLAAKVRFARKASPRIHPISDMDFQPKYLPQQSSPLFTDGRSMRPPIAGTVAVDQRIDDPHWLLGETEGQPATTFPLPVTAELVQRGRERYEIFCATCHGLAGDGDGITSELAFEREEPTWVPPLSVHNPTVRQQPVGQIFKTISEGIRTMPGYRSQIPVEDRWAIVLYVRALQRSRHATIDDVSDPDKRAELEKLLPQTE